MDWEFIERKVETFQQGVEADGCIIIPRLKITAASTTLTVSARTNASPHIDGLEVRRTLAFGF